jgi:hypothetical protein
VKKKRGRRGRKELEEERLPENRREEPEPLRTGRTRAPLFDCHWGISPQFLWLPPVWEKRRKGGEGDAPLGKTLPPRRGVVCAVGVDVMGPPCLCSG